MSRTKSFTGWTNAMLRRTEPQPIADVLCGEAKEARRSVRQTVIVSNALEIRIIRIANNASNGIKGYIHELAPSQRDMLQIMYEDTLLPVSGIVAPTAQYDLSKMVDKMIVAIETMNVQSEMVDVQKSKIMRRFATGYERRLRKPDAALEDHQIGQLSDLLYARFIAVFADRYCKDEVFRGNSGLAPELTKQIEISFARVRRH